MPSLRRVVEVLAEEALPSLYPPRAEDVPTSEAGVKLPLTKSERRSIAPGNLRQQTGAQGRSTAARREREWRDANPYPLNPSRKPTRAR